MFQVLPIGLNGQTINAPDTAVGLQLRITPRVNQDGLILMPLTVTNSSLGNVDAGIPVGFGANGEVIRSPIINTTQRLERRSVPIRV